MRPPRAWHCFTGGGKALANTIRSMCRVNPPARGRLNPVTGADGVHGTRQAALKLPEGYDINASGFFGASCTMLMVISAPGIRSVVPSPTASARQGRGGSSGSWSRSGSGCPRAGQRYSRIGVHRGGTVSRSPSSYAFEQATGFRQPPESAPPLSSEDAAENIEMPETGRPFLLTPALLPGILAVGALCSVRRLAGRG